MGIMGALLSMASLLVRVLIQVVGGVRSCELNAPLIIRTPMVQKKVSTLARLPYIFRGCSIACKKLFSRRGKMALSKKKKKCLRRWVCGHDLHVFSGGNCSVASERAVISAAANIC